MVSVCSASEVRVGAEFWEGRVGAVGGQEGAPSVASPFVFFCESVVCGVPDVRELGARGCF